MPVGATPKQLEHVASGNLGAGAGLAWLKCSCNTERGTNVGTSQTSDLTTATCSEHGDGRQRAGTPMPGHPSTLEGHFGPTSSLCGVRGCSACPRPGRWTSQAVLQMCTLPGKGGKPLAARLALGPQGGYMGRSHPVIPYRTQGENSRLWFQHP